MRSCLSYVLLVYSAVVPHCTGAQQLWGTTMRGGADMGGTLYRVNADNSAFVEVMHEFAVDINAAHPVGPLALATDNKFYGVSSQGGTNNQGTIFRFDPVTHSYTTLWEFVAPDVLPGGGLMQATNGKLYGVCSAGGTSGGGVIYSFDITTGSYARVFSFTNLNAHGASPYGELIEGAPGKLYGINKDGGAQGSSGIGVLFEFNLNTQAFTKLHTFTNTGGTRPTGGVTLGADGKLYGVTISNGGSDRGTLYSYDKASNTFAEIHEFKNHDGARPSSAPLAHSNGKIYGIAMGDHQPNAFGTDDGVIYEYDPALAGTGFLIKDRFGDGVNDAGVASLGGVLEGPGGKIYFLTVASGSNIVEYDPVSQTTTARVTSLPASYGARGDNSFAAGPGGELYTAFREGGATGKGSIVKYSPATNIATKVLDLGSSSSGAYPYGDLVKANNGKLYGMASGGGDHGLGIIFEIDPATGAFTKKHDFDGPNGATPLGGMILSSNGKLYGTTTFGGPSLEERSYQANPNGHLAGAQGHGVLFEYDPVANTYSKKQHFNAALGTNPYGNLVEASNGKLYGVTSRDGANGGGTLYQYVISGAITKHHDFPTAAVVPGVDNSGPKCQLTELDGKLYGTTPYFGANNGGTLFEFSIQSNTLTTVASFSASSNHSPTSLGSNPHGGLVVHDAKLYGVTFNGGVNATSSALGGTLYEYTPGTTAVVKKVDLPAGAQAGVSALVIHSGILYGAFTYSPDSQGGLFAYNPATNVFTKKVEFDGANGAAPQWGALAIVITKLGQTINFPQPDQQEFQVTPQSSPFITVPTVSSAGLPVTYTSSNPSVAHTDVAGRITQVGVGTTIITATQSGNADYVAVTVERILTIVKGHQNISWPTPNQTPKLSQATVTLLATASSGLPITYTSSNPTIATVSGNIMTLKTTGSVNIQASQPGTVNYHAAPGIQIPFVVQRGDQSITFSPLAAREVSDVSFTLDATATSHLPVTYTSSVVAVATIVGNTVNIVAPGTTMITASQAGDTNWNPATAVVRSLVVNKISQTITFEAPAAQTLGAGPLIASATASSGLAVSFTTSTPERVTIAGSSITLLTAGLASLTARQAGDAAYKEAAPVTRSFCINPVKPVITTSINNAGDFILSTVQTGSLQWYRNGEAVNSATGPTLTPSAAGGYTVVVDVQGCKSAPSDVMEVIVTGVTPAEGTAISYYPNPASDKLHIFIPHNKGSRVSIIGMECRVMENMLTSDEEVSVSVGGYPTGLYILKVDGEVRRFFKQ
jgi:uncharacterized repeat protein (TIGR03803 family)